jgi:hypothetical protein
MERCANSSWEGWRKACSSCHAVIDARCWQRLPVVFRICREELERVLTVRVTWTVEVRRCTCGALMASMKRPEGSSRIDLAVNG